MATCARVRALDLQHFHATAYAIFEIGLLTMHVHAMHAFFFRTVRAHSHKHAARRRANQEPQQPGPDLAVGAVLAAATGAMHGPAMMRPLPDVIPRTVMNVTSGPSNVNVWAHQHVHPTPC